MRITSGTGAQSVVNGMYCGSTLPMPITSESNTLTLEFNSDNSVQKTGFLALFFTSRPTLVDVNIEMQIEICVTEKEKSIGDFNLRFFMSLAQS